MKNGKKKSEIYFGMSFWLLILAVVFEVAGIATPKSSPSAYQAMIIGGVLFVVAALLLLWSVSLAKKGK